MNLYYGLKANKLGLNMAKTEFMVIASRQKLPVERYGNLNIKLDNQPTNQ